MSHGPLIAPPEIVSTGLPRLSITIRQPACAVADVPSDVGKLPTITHPDCNTDNAVVNPTPPGHAPGRFPALSSANTANVEPSGAISTIVVPVPCAFVTLLKLLTKKWPAWRLPTDRCTSTMPYGLTSPFPGTVVETTL